MTFLSWCPLFERHLTRRGFPVSFVGLMDIKETYTTHEVGQICQVDYTTVSRWVEQGKLEAFQTAGGHRRIQRRHLVEFLKRNNIPLPSELLKEGRVRILAVDDEETLLGMYEKILQKTGWDYELEKARDGFEAGQKIMAFDPDLIILDLFLPGMDGFKVCERIAGLKRRPPMRVLAVSGELSPANREKILKAGAGEALAKPFLPKDVTDKLAALCPPLAKSKAVSS